MNICGRGDLFLIFTCFWEEKLTSADVVTFFLVFTCFGEEKWTSADVVIFIFWSSLVLGQKIVTLWLTEPTIFLFSAYDLKFDPPLKKVRHPCVKA